MTDGKADKVPVHVVQRNTETALVAGAIKEGDAIVTEGLDGLKPGADVQVPSIDKVACANAAQCNQGLHRGLTR